VLLRFALAIVALLLSSAPAVAGDATGTLRVMVVEGWGEVWVDGERRGLTPLNLELPTGPHEVRIAATSYHEEWSTTVLVEADRVSTVQARPASSLSEVRFGGYPSEARVRVNGLDLGRLKHLDAVRIAEDGTYDIDLRLGDSIVASFRVLRCAKEGCLLPGGTLSLTPPPPPAP